VKIFEGQYVKASEHVAGLPPGTDALVARAMAVEPSQRFASMLAFREALLALPAPGRGGWSRTEPTGSSAPASELAARPQSVAPPVASRGRVWLVALVIAAVAAAAALALSQRQRVPPGGDPSAGVPAEPPPPRADSTSKAAPSVLPAPPVASALEAPSVSSAEPAPAKAATARPALPRPAGSPVRDSRAERDGLARDNPFQ
jgi:hypothetical protein